MKIEANINKKYFIILLGAILVLAGAIYVNAYNSGMSPNVFGHSGEEIEVIIDGETKLLNDALVLNCTQAQRYEHIGDTGTFEIHSGWAGAVELNGTPSAADVSWGLRCISPYQKTGCHMSTGAGVTDSDLRTLTDGNGCYTDNDEYSGGASIFITCCKIG